MGHNGSFNMVERQEPKFVQFGAGDVLAGVLLGIETVRVKDKNAARFTLANIENPGEKFAFLGTAQINAQLSRADVGHMVEVRCTGEDKNVIRNVNAMKTFKIFVSDKPVTHDNGDPLFITDADLPAGF